MSSSLLKEVLVQAKQNPSRALVSSLVMTILENLLRQTIAHCDANKVSLSSFEGLGAQVTEWHSYLLSIYRELYTQDCQKSLRTQKPLALRGLKDSMICNSKVIRSLIEFLGSRDCPKLFTKLNRVVEQVHTEVFGPKVGMSDLEDAKGNSKQPKASKKRKSTSMIGSEMESGSEEAREQPSASRASVAIISKNAGLTGNLDLENAMAKTFFQNRTDFRKHRTNKLMRLSKEHQETGFIYTPEEFP